MYSYHWKKLLLWSVVSVQLILLLIIYFFRRTLLLVILYPNCRIKLYSLFCYRSFVWDLHFFHVLSIYQWYSIWRSLLRLTSLWIKQIVVRIIAESLGLFLTLAEVSLEAENFLWEWRVTFLISRWRFFINLVFIIRFLVNGIDSLNPIVLSDFFSFFELF